MYISKIVLKNIKCFDNITIDFITPDGACLGCVFLGDNGIGKSTILRSIALSLCGELSVSGLLDELYGEWIKKGKTEGEIQLEIIDPDEKNKRYQVKTIFKKGGPGDPYTIKQETIPEKFPWDDFFICGYGASRGTYGDMVINEYYATDSVYSLFNYKESHLQNPELAIRRITDINIGNSEEIQKKVLNLVSKILMFSEGAIKLEKGLIVKNPFGESMPLQELGDGHIATATMIIDMIGWLLLYDDTMFQSDISEIAGIVIIDEIEQHLHPLWKRKIIPLLRTVFPKVQFIMTTHSPLIAANINIHSPKMSRSKLLYLNRDNVNKTIQINEIEEDIEKLNLDQILASEAFGHIFNVNEEIDEILKKASKLAAKDKRSPDEEKIYNEFKERLKRIMFPKGRTLIERIVEKDYYEDLKKEKEEFKKLLEGKR